jgi:hypothetical protein
MEQVWRELGANKVQERYVKFRDGLLGYQEPGLIVVSPLNMVPTILHELLHAAYPSWTERAVQRTTTRLWRHMSDDESLRLWVAYNAKVTRVLKPAPCFPNEDWMLYARLFYRGWLIVTLTALNVAMISRYAWGWAFLSSTALSAVWWGNSKHAAHVPNRWAGPCYALGAGAGCVTGMMLGKLLYYLT